jgi:predicted RNase H-like nuclease (RuvC/YqgF family)
MSDERGETIDLAYIGRALQRLTTEVASLREDMRVLTAIVLRHEETLIRTLEQITAMVAQNARIVDRLRAAEERIDALEDKTR